MKNISKLLKTKFFNITLARKYSLDNHYDICIVGGGPVGFGLASLLGAESNLRNKKILILEAQKQKAYKQKPEFSNRTVALSPKTKNTLESNIINILVLLI